MIEWQMIHVAEPRLSFGYGQTAEHPKDGLLLFGPPASNQNPARMDVGVIGTVEGIALYQSWVRAISTHIAEPEKGRPENKMMWPGFQAVFGIAWPETPFATCVVDGQELSRRIRIEDRHEAIYEAVNVYDSALRKYLREEGPRPGLWFAILPEEVFKYGRPKSTVPRLEREKSRRGIGRRAAKTVLQGPWLFPEDLADLEMYRWELNFHNQLKARTLDTDQVIQVVRETTLASRESTTRRSLQDPASVAWNLGATSFYKAGGTPWRIANVREGVCYVGLVFKRIDNLEGRDNACCGAQMFLSTGEGVVFKGAVGPWYSETEKAYHLTTAMAAKLMTLVVDAYRDLHGRAPSELFIHGQTWFTDEEWTGFSSTVPEGTTLVGVRIRRQSEVKLFRYGKKPVLRGTAIITSPRSAYLWTAGFTPRLETYPGREVPNPLTIDLTRGDADMKQVLSDLMALTKLNFNASNFSDGLPVTLRFADQIGEILTAGPPTVDAPLPFRRYI